MSNNTNTNLSISEKISGSLKAHKKIIFMSAAFAFVVPVLGYT